MTFGISKKPLARPPPHKKVNGAWSIPSQWAWYYPALSNKSYHSELNSVGVGRQWTNEDSGKRMTKIAEKQGDSKNRSLLAAPPEFSAFPEVSSCLMP